MIEETREEIQETEEITEEITDVPPAAVEAAESEEAPLEPQAAAEEASAEPETIQVVSIKFRNRGKMYYFAPQDFTFREGDKAIVETSKGLEIGDVVQGNHLVRAAGVVQPLRPVVRPATEEDKRIANQCRQREREAFVICKKRIEAHGLEMKLVDVECSFEGNKILFFFSSDGRVDFRELVKDLASVFRTRIELRQIGVRDEARMLGGLGICGRPFCCGTFMEEFQPVSTKMAKTQSMSLNPAKISGCCGRLMCCLRYEQPAYEELVKNVPKNGAFVETPDGYGNVTQVNVLRQYVKVKLDDMGEDSIRQYDVEDVAAIPGGRPRDGSQPPHVLVLKPKAPKEPAESTDNGWDMPSMLVSDGLEPEKKQEPQPRRNQNRRKRDFQPRDNQNREPRESGQPRENRENNRSPRPNKGKYPKQGGQRPERPAGEKREGDKPQQNAPKRRPQNQNQNQNQRPRPERPAGEEGEARENREQRPKKPYYNNRRKNYRPRPKSGGNGGEGE
jgi:cell fate regulator YaaT (PSP1 superfamily)